MWIVAGVSLIGTVLNVYKRRGGFAVWAVTDVAWVAYDLSIGANAQAALLAIYGAMAVWGFLKWRDNGSERDALSAPGGERVQGASGSGGRAVKLRPYQVQAVQAVTQAFENNASALIVMPTGCHAEGSLVLGFDGLPKRVEAVQIGDALMGPDGAPRIVLHLARGVAPLVRIRPIKGAPFVVTSDHVLALVRTEDDADKRKRGGEVVDVPVCEWLRWSKTQKHLHKLFRASVDFDQEHQDFWWNRFRLPAYFVGAMLGVGSFRRQMSFTCADEKVIEEIVLTLSMLDIDAHELTKHHCGNARQFIFQSLHRHAQEQKNLRKYFALMGLNMANAESKRIPYAYRIAPRADRIEYLAGLMDTDGHATCGGYDYVSKSRLLAEDVAFVARSLGLAAYVAACEKFCQTGGGGTYYRVSISGNCSMVPCRVPRKRYRSVARKKMSCGPDFRLSLWRPESTSASPSPATTATCWTTSPSRTTPARRRCSARWRTRTASAAA